MSEDEAELLRRLDDGDETMTEAEVERAWELEDDEIFETRIARRDEWEGGAS